MSKILVTGGTGFIGSHTVVELQEAGYDVIIVDDLSNSKAEVVDNIEKITGKRPEFENFDLSNRADVLNFFFRNNLNSLMNILESMKFAGVRNLVFSSSCTVYGQPEKLPVTESTPRLPAESPYGNTKTVNEDIIRDFCAAEKEINGLALRYFNPIGAHPSSLIGESPVGVPNNLVPYITQTAAGIRKELSIFGNDYDTPDGTPIRDYIDVVDLSKAHVVAIRRLMEGKNKSNYEFFNVGTGRGLSVLELVNAFKKSTGVDLPYKIVGRRAGDIVKIWADTTLANTELGWKAEVPIEQTLLNAWNWEKKCRGIR